MDFKMERDRVFEKGNVSCYAFITCHAHQFSVKYGELEHIRDRKKKYVTTELKQRFIIKESYQSSSYCGVGAVYAKQDYVQHYRIYVLRIYAVFS